MGKGYLLDTNTVIDFSSRRLPASSQKKIAVVIDAQPYISIINKIELLGFSEVPDIIEVFTKKAFVIALDDDIVSQTIALRKKHKIKLADAIIAATALVFDLALITHDIADYKNIKGLQLVNSYEM